LRNIVRYGYAYTKLSDAAHTLAVSPGKVRERLCLAALSLSPLSESHFPITLHTEWKALWIGLTRYGPVADEENRLREGAIQHTVRRIRPSTASRLACQIFALWRRLEIVSSD
jgi:hypothetical protein